MTVIPCEQDPRLRAQIEGFAEILKTQAHQLGSHGLDGASRDEDVNYVDFEVSGQTDELFRRTVIRRGGVVQHASEMTAIQRV